MTVTASAPPLPAAVLRRRAIRIEAAGLGTAVAVALVAMAHLCLTPRAWLLFSDGDSVLLPLLRASQQVGEPQRWALSSVLFLPEQALYDATAALGVGVRGALAVDGVVNLVLLYACFRVVAELARRGPRSHRVAGAVLAFTAFGGFTLLDSSAAWDSLELPSLLATTTYYSATVLATVLAVGLGAALLDGSRRTVRLTLVLGGLTALSVWTDPLFVLWAVVPLGIVAVVLVVARRIPARRTVAPLTAAIVGIGVGLVLRIPFASEIARDTSAYLHPSNAWLTAGYLLKQVLLRMEGRAGLLSVAGIITVIAVEAVLARRALRRGSTRSTVLLGMGAAGPLVVIAGTVLAGAAAARYLQPVWFLPLVPLVLLPLPGRLRAVVRGRRVRAAVAVLLVVAGIAGGGVTAAAAATPDPAIRCLDGWILASGRTGAGRFETVRGPKALLPDPRRLLQVDSRLHAEQWLTDRADYAVPRVSFLITTRSEPAFATGAAGAPVRTIGCGPYRILDWERPVLTVTTDGRIVPPHPPSTAPAAPRP